jgi:DNA-3-methyladenine glycosylase II
VTARDDGWRGSRVYTIGHSTRTIDELVTLLRAHGVSILADIRTIPRSRHNPQFNRGELGRALRNRRIRYVHLASLGGLRHAAKDSGNAGWHNASFRGYADYMQTDGFAAGLEELRRLAAGGTVALMCAEAVPWRCHRSLVADALCVRGAQVRHIASATNAPAHKLTEFAKVSGLCITYPAIADPVLETRGPFNLEATVRVLQRRPTNLVDVWDEGRYLRALSTRRGNVLVEVANKGTIDAPEVSFRVLAGKDTRAVREGITRDLRRILALDVDPAPLLQLVANEPRLDAVATALRGVRPPRFPGLFETFVHVIPFQQLSLDAGVAVVRRLVERFGETVKHAGREFRLSPTSAVIAAARLDAIKSSGLSRKKAETLRGIARDIEAGELAEDQLTGVDCETAMERLVELPGIGRWSAALVLLRGMGRLEVFPEGDSGATRGLSSLFKVTPGRALDRIVRRFGDHRGYLYFFSLGNALLGKGLIHAGSGPCTPKAGRISA